MVMVWEPSVRGSIPRKFLFLMWISFRGAGHCGYGAQLNRRPVGALLDAC
jgi:hypothetical protein